jgi:hypothetical protein
MVLVDVMAPTYLTVPCVAGPLGTAFPNATSGAIAMSGAHLCFFDGTSWKSCT